MGLKYSNFAWYSKALAGTDIVSIRAGETCRRNFLKNTSSYAAWTSMLAEINAKISSVKCYPLRASTNRSLSLSLSLSLSRKKNTMKGEKAFVLFFTVRRHRKFK